MTKKKVLVVVDVQYDFYSKSGSLYVPSGEKIIPEIEKLIREDKNIDQVIFTVDWHTPEDRSFKENGGKWPRHCIQYSLGASIHHSLIEAVLSRGFNSVDGRMELGEDGLRVSETYDVFRKGDTPGHEEYGAFTNYTDGDGIVILQSFSEDSSSYIPIDHDIVICGLAGDFCVSETAENLEDIGFKVYQYEPGIKYINEDGKKLGLEKYIRR